MDDHARSLGARLLAESREELAKADNKAQVLLGITGVGLGAITGGLLAGNWSPFKLSNAVEWLWWAGIAAAVAAVTLIAAAVYPRGSHPHRSDAQRINYFGDLAQFASPEAITDALRLSGAFELERTSHQLHRLSRIVGRKYRLIRFGFWLLLFALVTTTGAVLVNLALK